MATRRQVLKSAALLGLGAWPVLARAGSVSLAAVPVAGHFTHDAVRLWVQSTGEARATIAFRPEAAQAAAERTVEATLSGSRLHAAVVKLEGLEPDTAYRYRVSLEGGAAGEPGRFRTAPAPGGKPRDFRVYLGSCAYTETHTRGGTPYGDELHVFDTMAAQMGADRLPHFMLWLGDNLYLRNASRSGAPADWSSAALMQARYRDVRALPFLQKLLAATHHYAIWDDHDYGPNNSDRHFALKDESLRLFGAYWPNPDTGASGAPGTSGRFRQEDAEFFLLDGRFHRDPEKAPADPAKAMFGEAQMRWLRDGLAQSKAAFKVVCSGSQLLSQNANGVTSGWHSYEGERGRFLAWLAGSGVPGVIFLSGDRHNTQVFRLDIAGAAPVHEFSCSPLTSKLAALSEAERANPRLLAPLAVEKRNFGTLEFARQGGRRVATARCFDSRGEPLWTQVLATV
jgi:alkaline phosphatase D